MVQRADVALVHPIRAVAEVVGAVGDQPGKSVQNAFVESLNGKLRDECLNLPWFRSLQHAHEEIGRWRHYHHTERPHAGACLPNCDGGPHHLHRDSA